MSTPAVPFCHLAFSAPRPAIRRYERIRVPEGTLGAAFRERRWSRGLEQWEAAEEIGVSVATYRNRNRLIRASRGPRKRWPRGGVSRLARPGSLPKSMAGPEPSHEMSAWSSGV